MSGVNKVILVGRTGKDPEVRYIDGGTPVAKFPLATDESYKKKNGEKVENTEWHNIVAWRGLAEVIEKYVKKGDQLYIEGKIKTTSYTDKNDVKRYRTEIICDNIQMLGSKNKEDRESPAETVAEKPVPENNATESKETDDLPF